MNYKKILRENYRQLLFVFFAFVVMVLLSSVFTIVKMTRYLADSASLMLESAEDKMRLKFLEIESSLINTSLAINNMKEDGRSVTEIQRYLEELGEYFRSSQDILSGFQHIVGVIEGEFFYDQPRPVLEGYVPHQRPWYQATLTNPGRVVFSSPYQDLYSRVMVISASTLLRERDGGVFGVLALEASVRDITEFIAFMKIISGGYGVLISPDMTIVTHRYSEMVGERFTDVDPAFQSLANRLIIGDGSIIPTEYQRPYGRIVAFYRRMANGWLIGIATPKQEYYQELYVMVLFMVALGFGMMIILSYFLIRLSMAKIHSDDENRAKSSFLARVSHEIRTPMNSILGMSEIIMRKNISEEIYEYISIIRQAGSTLLAIINDILDFSKIESGKVEIESKPYNMSSLINDVVNVIRIRLQDKPIDFFVRVDSHIPAELVGDEVRIRQVLINLLNNAVKYTLEGFVLLDVRVEFPETPAGHEAMKLKLIMRVQDSGIGIRGEDLEKLFSDFTRVDVEKNRHIEGAGLGLSITKILCAAMGGDISVESQYGVGSVFTAVVIQGYNNTLETALVKSPETLNVLLFEERPSFAKHFLEAIENLGVTAVQVQTLDDFIADITGRGIKNRPAPGTTSNALSRPAPGTTPNTLSRPAPGTTPNTLSRFDYAFVSSRYADRCIPAWRQAMSKVKLVIMIEIGDISGFRNVGSIHLPVYSTVLANLLNGEMNVNHGLYDFRIRIIAPDAKALIVDDIATNLRVAAELMAPYGLKIDTCLSGLQAIEMVKQNRYDIVFMDHMMPEMDGIAATQAIRAMAEGDSYYRQLPIVMLTANAVSGQREMFLQNGINDFLPKPIEVQQLNDILEKWIPKTKQKKSSTPVLWDFEEERSLLSINGVNAQVGLRNAGDSLKAYKKVLAVFVDDVDERIPQINAALTGSGLNLYTTLVHALKGASRSIGAEYIGELAAELEEAGRAENMVMILGKNGIFLEKLQILRDTVADALDSSDEDEEKAGAAEEGTVFSTLDLEGLKEALVNMDTDLVNEKLTGYGDAVLQKQVRKYIEDIEQDVLLFEYDKAVEKIDALLSGKKPEDQ